MTITGSNLSRATGVNFGGTAATNVSVLSDGLITATSPAGTGKVDVTVIEAAGTSISTSADQFTYVASPAVTGVSPASGPAAGGTSVTITGTNFTGATAVKFGTKAASNVKVNSSGTQITATSPAGRGTVDVTVTTPGGASPTSTADKFNYGSTVTGISPASGPAKGGTSVTIIGTNFTGATAVKFGTKAASSFKLVSSTKITATSPKGTGTVDVTVTTPGGTSAVVAADKFTYGGGKPTVRGFSLESGPVAGSKLVGMAPLTVSSPAHRRALTTGQPSHTVPSMVRLPARWARQNAPVKPGRSLLAT